jgi:plastocyanin
MTKQLPIVLLIGVLAFAWGCGGSSGPQRPPGPNEVVLTEYEFTPRIVTVKRGTVLKVRNDGQIAHNLTVERRTPGSQKLIGTDSFLGGRSARLRVDLPPGRYKMLCTVPGHAQLGMVGTLAVR